MEGSIQPPTVDAEATSAATPNPAVDAAETTAAPLYPGWVLLEKEAYDDKCENATTAEAKTIAGLTVKVTFFLADPPAISRFYVYGPELEHEDYRFLPRVVFSEKHLVLLHIQFGRRPGSAVREHPPHPAQYFVYGAAHGGQPSLTPIPATRRPADSIASYPIVLPFDDEHGDFLVADLAITPTRGHYVLHIFSSKNNQWTTTPLQLPAPPPVTDDLPSLPHKAIALGAGAIGWIDLSRGILVCNVFDPDPVLRFIPLPKPEFDLRRRGDPQRIRDVTFCNGFIKFIEMEQYPRPDCNIERNFKTTKDLDTEHVLYDSDLFLRSFQDLTEEPVVPLTWKIRTCFRHTSWNLWRKTHPTLHVDDISVNDPSYFMDLPELWDFSAAKFTLRNLTAVRPTLSIHGGELVYLVLKVGADDNKAWVAGVDLRNKTLEVLSSSFCGRPFLACTFSRYLNTTPRYLYTMT
ncbi:hypothetical protein ACQ4PT_053466 [Festuca glaucescens]